MKEKSLKFTISEITSLQFRLFVTFTFFPLSRNFLFPSSEEFVIKLEVQTSSSFLLFIVSSLKLCHKRDKRGNFFDKRYEFTSSLHI